MKPLIDTYQKNEVECDNPKCDFVVPNKTGIPNPDSQEWLDVPCPKCGENLLTVQDWIAFKKHMEVIKFINKWFSWLNILSCGRSGKKKTVVSVKIHDGIKVKKFTDD